jgi:hypothetical protein
MNNEPVAWMIKTLDGRSLMLYGEEQPPKFKEDVQYIPLYIHPVKEQDESFDRTASHMVGEYVSYKAELTDEEIGDFEHQIIRACGLSTANSDINPIGIRQIIKEILRKAQEK